MGVQATEIEQLVVVPNVPSGTKFKKRIALYNQDGTEYNAGVEQDIDDLEDLTATHDAEINELQSAVDTIKDGIGVLKPTMLFGSTSAGRQAPLKDTLGVANNNDKFLAEITLREKQIGRKYNMVHYYTMSVGSTRFTIPRALREAGARGYTILLDMSCSLSPAQVLSGAYDQLLKDQMSAMIDIPFTPIITWFHEMNYGNGSSSPWVNGTNPATPSDHVAGARHLIQLYKSVGAKGKHYWNPGNDDISVLSQWYWGDDVTDIVGPDIYPNGYTGDALSGYFLDKYSFFMGQFNAGWNVGDHGATQAHDHTKTKPFACAEFNLVYTTQGGRALYIQTSIAEGLSLGLDFMCMFDQYYDPTTTSPLGINWTLDSGNALAGWKIVGQHPDLGGVNNVSAIPVPCIRDIVIPSSSITITVKNAAGTTSVTSTLDNTGNSLTATTIQNALVALASVGAGNATVQPITGTSGGFRIVFARGWTHQDIHLTKVSGAGTAVMTTPTPVQSIACDENGYPIGGGMQQIQWTIPAATTFRVNLPGVTGTVFTGSTCTATALQNEINSAPIFATYPCVVLGNTGGPFTLLTDPRANAGFVGLIVVSGSGITSGNNTFVMLPNVPMPYGARGWATRPPCDIAPSTYKTCAWIGPVDSTSHIMEGGIELGKTGLTLMTIRQYRSSKVMLTLSSTATTINFTFQGATGTAPASASSASAASVIDGILAGLTTVATHSVTRLSNGLFLIDITSTDPTVAFGALTVTGTGASLTQTSLGSFGKTMTTQYVRFIQNIYGMSGFFGLTWHDNGANGRLSVFDCRTTLHDGLPHDIAVVVNPQGSDALIVDGVQISAVTTNNTGTPASASFIEWDTLGGFGQGGNNNIGKIDVFTNNNTTEIIQSFDAHCAAVPVADLIAIHNQRNIKGGVQPAVLADTVTMAKYTSPVDFEPASSVIWDGTSHWVGDDDIVYDTVRPKAEGPIIAYKNGAGAGPSYLVTGDVAV